MNKKIIVFSPHPDDETFACGGTIAKRISEGYDVLIVVMTDGQNAFSKVFGIFSDPSPEDLIQIRKDEVIKAAKILGVPSTNLFFLDFVDGSLEECAKDAEKIAIEILENCSPVEIYFPSEKDAHPDHRATNRVIRNAVKELGIEIPRYKYSIVRPYSRIGPLIDKCFDCLNSNIFHVNIKEFSHLKELAIKEYKSQIGIISDKQKKPLIKSVEKFLKDVETFYIDK